jgi:dTDP-4-dehydrorhamnose reductase
MLGHAVCKVFRQRGASTVPLTRSEFNIARDPMITLTTLLDVDSVVNCAGVIKPRISSVPIEEVLQVNGIFPLNLARVCAVRGVPLVHVTTDCVFSGRRGSYTEDDLFDADDVYGLSKAAGDAAQCMVLRTSIIGEELAEQRSLLEWARSQRGKEINGFTNHRWNGLTTVTLANVIWRILNEARYRTAIVHLFSPHPLTKAELVQTISDTYGLELRVRPAPAAEACDRTLASTRSLSVDLQIPNIDEQLRSMREFFRKS